MKKELELKAKKLRLEGYSVKELHKILGVSKSTVSGWIQNVELSDKARARLRQNYTNGQIASQKTIKEKTIQKNAEAYNFAVDLFKKVDLSSEIILLFCALIYQCEGSKNIKDAITFTNSDPNLIKTFLFLFRKSFELDEKKLKVLMHLHKYHDEKTQKIFWSETTGIPEGQFNKSYLKPNSGIYKKEEYQGCIQISYNSAALGRKISAIANMFMERYK